LNFSLPLVVRTKPTVRRFSRGRSSRDRLFVIIEQVKMFQRKVELQPSVAFGRDTSARLGDYKTAITDGGMNESFTSEVLDNIDNARTQQSRLSTPGRSDEDHELFFLDREVDIFEGMEAFVVLLNRGQFEVRHRGSWIEVPGILHPTEFPGDLRSRRRSYKHSHSILNLFP
jgi:hypothetical protein